ncbi:hypothetical protein [Chthonobacter albigriseus]|uniref:hypothetical protein n=1 Tax=Chthonobacter albigriseus TaxID=1683161 RepID=UPI0015EE5FFB|nr:hypothetical protein [Chthonobacter albigriseus]
MADEFASLLEGGNGDRAPAAGRFFDEVFRIARNIRTRNDILRLQVFLRNRGFESVVITGRLDGPTRTATERCSTDDPCAAEFITFVPCPTQCETPVERKPVESVARRS